MLNQLYCMLARFCMATPSACCPSTDGVQQPRAGAEPSAGSNGLVGVCSQDIAPLRIDIPSNVPLCTCRCARHLTFWGRC